MIDINKLSLGDRVVYANPNGETKIITLENPDIPNVKDLYRIPVTADNFPNDRVCYDTSIGKAYRVTLHDYKILSNLPLSLPLIKEKAEYLAKNQLSRNISKGEKLRYPKDGDGLRTTRKREIDLNTEFNKAMNELIRVHHETGGTRNALQIYREDIYKLAVEMILEYWDKHYDTDCDEVKNPDLFNPFYWYDQAEQGLVLGG